MTTETLWLSLTAFIRAASSVVCISKAALLTWLR